jgi:hypothetical protein
MPTITPITATAGPIAVLKIGTATVPASDWKFDIDPKLKDISNFVSGRTYIGTLAEGSMSFRMIWDTAAMPTDPAGLNLLPGASVIARCYTDATKFFEVPLLIGKVTPHLPGIEDVVHYEVEAKLSGAIVYPVIP